MGLMKQDTILAHSLARAFLATGDQEPTAWKLAKVTPKASRVTALIVMWSLALADLERDSLGVEEYVAWAAESRATVHRHLRDFRELWEQDTPNEIARALLRAAESQGSRPAHTTLVAA
jgi:hypothetical protein